MIDIELEDADRGDSPPGGGAPAGARPSARDHDPAQPGGGGRQASGRGRTVRRLVQVLALVVVVAVVVITNVNEHARDVRGDEAVAAMPGLVGSLDEPLDLVWERPGFGGPASGLIFGQIEDDWAPLYPETGEPIPLPLGDGEVWGPCGAVDGAEPAMLVCWRYEQPTTPDQALPTGTRSPGPALPDVAAPVPVYPDPASPEALLLAAMADARLVAVSSVDGAVLAERPMAAPTVGFGLGSGIGSVDGDLVVGSQEGRTLTVTRVDPLTGLVRWARSVEEPDGDPLAFNGVRVEVRHGLVVVHGPTTAVLSAEDGRQVDTWVLPALGVGEMRSVRDGADVEVTGRGYAVWDGIEGQVRSLRGTWFGNDGREVELEGRLAEPEVTDGSDGDVLLLARRNGIELVGVDLASGDDLWTAGLRGGEVLVRCDGAVVVSDGQRVVAFDLRSGQERWSRSVEGLRPDEGSVTDGRNVVVVATLDHERVLAAISLESGAVSWTVPAPSGGGDVPGSTSIGLARVGTQVLVLAQEAVLGLR